MILITGASSGLGASLARLYGNEGETLTLTGRDPQRLHDVALGCGENVTALAASLSDPAQVAKMLDNLEAPPSMVIHCAGSGLFGPLEEQDPQAIEQLVQNNLLSSIYLLQELVKRYRDNKTTVVMVMSTAAQTAKAEESTYCAVKWGVKGLVESTRLELKGSAMNLIAVYPGGMATDFWSTSGKNLDSSTFMSGHEAGLMLKQALQSSQHGYVSDITINRF